MIGNNGLASKSDYYTDVSNGKIPGRSILSAMGERVSMGITVTGEDIYRGNDLSAAGPTSLAIPPDAGTQMTFVSESVNDIDGGTGVRKITHCYVDANGDMQSEEITMNGTTPVNTVATDIRFSQDMCSSEVGSNGVAFDNIKVYKTGGDPTVDLYNMVAQGGNKSMVPSRMVPAGHEFILVDWDASEAQTRRVAFRIRSTDFDGQLKPGIFCFKGSKYLKQSTLGSKNPTAIPAFSIIKVSGWPAQTGAESSCFWWGELIKL